MTIINTLIFVMGIYGLTFLITLFVVAVIIVIRWVSSDSVSVPILNNKRLTKREKGAA